MDINKRFEYIIDTLYNGNKRAFASAISISPSVIENIVGTRGGKPSYDVTYKVCANANISAEWLIMGEGDMLKSKDLLFKNTRQVSKPDIKTYARLSERKHDIQEVPLYNIEAAAGIIAIINDNNIIPEDYIVIPNIARVDAALYIKGNSMYPILKSGDIILIKEIDHTSYISYGDMYLISFMMNDEYYTSVKYIQKAENNDMLKLVSHNKAHCDQDIPISCIRAMAIVRASIRYNTM